MKHILKSEKFVLNIVPEIFEGDIKYSSNTIMEIKVQSDGFSANTTMDIDIKQFAKFSADLCGIYETLSGEARIEEPYGMHMYLCFAGNGRGHITIKGYLHKGDGTGNQSLEFENDIDQTYLKEFCYDLKNSYSKYL